MVKTGPLSVLAITIAIVFSVSWIYLDLPYFRSRTKTRGCSSQYDTYGADLGLLSRLGSTRLVQLSDGQESALEVLSKLRNYQALVVISAGRGGPTRRAENQPFISIAPEQGGTSSSSSSSATVGRQSTRHESHLADDDDSEGQDGGTGAPGSIRTVSGSPASPLAPLEGSMALMNAAAGAVEQVLGRRLFPITLSVFDRADRADGGGNATGPYAVFDASAGLLLLDRQLVFRTWAATDKPEVSYLTTQLAGGIFRQVAALLAGSRRAAGGGGGGTQPGTDPETAAAVDAAAADVYGLGGDVTSALLGVTSDAAVTGRGRRTLASEGLSRTQKQEKEMQKQEKEEEGVEEEEDHEEERESAVIFGADASIRPRKSSTQQDVPLTVLRPALMSAEADAGAAGAAGDSAAGAALAVLAAAVAAALPAAFAAAPPLWFCILCPSLLGLLAPLLINLALNQIAGALCSQLHLTDDVCFDVLLGALGAGFVLSLASAVPIFFVCQLPQCAGRNVTAVLRRVGAWR